MAHKQKFTKGTTGHMLTHYDRSKEVPDLPMPANTVLNYNLAHNDQPQTQLDFIHQRLSEVKVHNRKDVNVMVDWIVTAPKDLPMGDEDKFFKETYKFLNDRYGKENVISAYVHMDETTPHMHYAFVPVVEDKKKGGYKLSAKEAVTREDLRTFHSDFSKHLEKAFGRDIGVLNEATKKGNKSIKELKMGTSVERISEATSKAEQIISSAKTTVAVNLGKMEQDIRVTKEECHEMLQIAHQKVQSVQGDINTLENKKKTLEGKLEGLQHEIKGRELKINEINEIHPERTFTGTIKGVTVEDIENLKKTAIASVRALNEVKNLSQENVNLKRTVENLKSQIPSVMDKVKETKEKSILIKKAKAFDRLPDDIKRQLVPKTQIKSKDIGYER